MKRYQLKYLFFIVSFLGSLSWRVLQPKMLIFVGILHFQIEFKAFKNSLPLKCDDHSQRGMHEMIWHLNVILFQVSKSSYHGSLVLGKRQTKEFKHDAVLVHQDELLRQPTRYAIVRIQNMHYIRMFISVTHIIIP